MSLYRVMSAQSELCTCSGLLTLTISSMFPINRELQCRPIFWPLHAMTIAL